MEARSRIIVGFVALMAVLALVRKHRTPAVDPACAGPRLGNVEARQKAMEQGYAIDREHDCIGKQSFAEVEAANKLVDGMMRDAAASARAAGAIPDSGVSLARAG